MTPNERLAALRARLSDNLHQLALPSPLASANKPWHVMMEGDIALCAHVIEQMEARAREQRIIDGCEPVDIRDVIARHEREQKPDIVIDMDELAKAVLPHIPEYLHTPPEREQGLGPTTQTADEVPVALPVTPPAPATGSLSKRIMEVVNLIGWSITSETDPQLTALMAEVDALESAKQGTPCEPRPIVGTG